MVTRSKRRGFTLVELLVVIAIIGILVALLLPAIQAAREAARRNACTNNLKQLGTAIHNHHDVKKRMPLASTEDIDGIPADATTAGYSWIVQILPFMEETTLYDQISSTSNKFADPAFSTANVALGSSIGATAGAGDDHVANTAIAAIVCPSFGGESRVGDTPAPAATTSPYIETGVNDFTPAVSNYTCVPGSYFVNDSELPNATGSTEGDGGIVFPAKGSSAADGAKGLGFKALRDGTSKVVLITETKEQAFSAWYDGQATWVVAAWPEVATPPDFTSAGDGFLGWDLTTVSTTPQMALNVGEPDNDPADSEPYISTSSKWSGMSQRNWGPSSDHSGDQALMLWGDAHVTAVSVEDIDANQYLRLFTREGGEPSFSGTE
jgi:prepilin-type N-terminal cleavage/methylation domain-containing protein